MREIQGNILYAQQHAMAVAIIAALSITLWITLRLWKALPICVLLLLVAHPAWTVSAVKGDCGFFKATAVTVVSAGCLAVQGLVGIWSHLQPLESNHRL